MEESKEKKGDCSRGQQESYHPSILLGLGFLFGLSPQLRAAQMPQLSGRLGRMEGYKADK